MTAKQLAELLLQTVDKYGDLPVASFEDFYGRGITITSRNGKPSISEDVANTTAIIFISFQDSK